MAIAAYMLAVWWRQWNEGNACLVGVGGFIDGVSAGPLLLLCDGGGGGACTMCARACARVRACVVVAAAVVAEVVAVMAGAAVGAAVAVAAVAAVVWTVGDDSIVAHGIHVVRAGPHDPPTSPLSAPSSALTTGFRSVKHTTRLVQPRGPNVALGSRGLMGVVVFAPVSCRCPLSQTFVGPPLRKQ